MSKNNYLLVLFLVFLLGSYLRLFSPFHFTPSLNWDEVSLGYNAYSLLITGTDEWGFTLPTIFRAYGDYKLPIYIYLAVAPIKLFGLTAVSIRLVSSLAGSLLIPVVYVLARRLRFSSQVAAISALFIALEPWTLFLSKISLEANLAILFITAGLTLLISRKVLLSLLFFGFSIWTYNSARIFIPLFLFFTLFFYRNQAVSWIKKYPKCFFVSSLLLVTLYGGMFYQLFSPVGLARFNWLSLIDSGAITRIEDQRNLSTLPPLMTRLLYNRPLYFTREFTKNYLNHFLPDFLFLNGGSHYQFNIPQTGLLYKINLPFFYLGFLFLISKRNKYTPLLLIWLALAPIASSITRDSPHTLRAIPMLPLPMIFSSLGLSVLLSFFKKYWWLPAILYLSLVLVSFRQYFFIQSQIYRSEYSDSWQYGYTQLVDYLKVVYGQYDRILITKKYGEPHEFILFNWPWNPQKLQTDPNLNRYYRSNWYWVDSFAKFRFINDWEMVDYVAKNPQNRTLIIASPQNIPLASELDRILLLNGQPAFIILTQ